MSSESELIDVIRQKYTYGIKFDPASKMMLENMIGKEITDEEIEEIKNSMFTNKDEISFFLDSITDETTLVEIKTNVVAFVDTYGKYEQEAFFGKYENKINKTIIRNADDFQDLLEFILPKKYSNKTLVRLRVGQGMEKIVQAIEELVTDKFGGTVSFDTLKEEIPGFTEDRLKQIIDNNSKKLTFIDSPLGSYVETLDSFHLPEDFIDVVHDIDKKMTEMDIQVDLELMNPLLSLHYGYNFFADHGLTPESFRKIVETIDIVE